MPDQAEIQVKVNNKHDSYTYFHETYEGCYASTRESNVRMTETERTLQLLVPAYGASQSGYDYNGNDLTQS